MGLSDKIGRFELDHFNVHQYYVLYQQHIKKINLKIVPIHFPYIPIQCL